MKDVVDSHLMSMLAKVEMSLGEMQASSASLRQAPEGPPQGTSVRVPPLSASGITFSVHSVLATATSSQSRSVSLETEVSLVDLSSLPSSVGSAGDLA